MADGMERHGLAAAAAAGHRVMMLDPPAERAAAQEAGFPAHLFNQWRLVKNPSTTIPTRTQKAAIAQKPHDRSS